MGGNCGKEGCFEFGVGGRVPPSAPLPPAPPVTQNANRPSPVKEPWQPEPETANSAKATPVQLAPARVAATPVTTKPTPLLPQVPAVPKAAQQSPPPPTKATPQVETAPRRPVVEEDQHTMTYVASQPAQTPLAQENASGAPASADEEDYESQVDNIKERFPDRSSEEILAMLKKCKGHAGMVARSFKREEKRRSEQPNQTGNTLSMGRGRAGPWGAGRGGREDEDGEDEG